MMSDSMSSRERIQRFSGWSIPAQAQVDKQLDALAAALQASLAREEVLLREKHNVLQRQDTLAQEFDHRFANSLQMIMSLLSLQSRGAAPEVAAQLGVAARRVAAFGSVHRRLHLLDRQKRVEFKQYIEQLCGDFSNLLSGAQSDFTILVEGATVEISTEFAIPLGFIASEMVMNSAKYAKGNIIVRLETLPAAGHSLSVLDEGPGLPAGFDPTKSRGLGMKIILSFLKQIDGELQISRGDGGRGTRFTVSFRAPAGAP
ncbi:MAG: sensor histidine kinase [Methylovirgula sp.]